MSLKEKMRRRTGCRINHNFTTRRQVVAQTMTIKEERGEDDGTSATDSKGKKGDPLLEKNIHGRPSDGQTDRHLMVLPGNLTAETDRRREEFFLVQQSRG